MKNDKKTKINVSEFEDDYMYKNSIWNDDSERMNRIKYILNYQLSLPDRRLFIAYTELQSVRKVAKQIGLSYSTVQIEIQRIRQHIKQLLEKQQDFEIYTVKGEQGVQHIITKNIK